MRRLLSLVLPCLLLAASGCGADDVNPRNALADAAAATSKKGGVHMVGTGSAQAGGHTIPMKFEGDADLTGKRFRMTFESEVQGQEFDGEQILDGRTLYMRMDLFEQAFGVDWVKMDLNAVAEEAGFDLSALQQLGSQNPADQLAWLRAAGDVKEVGEEDVDGVATTHYKATVDLKTVPNSVPEAERAEVRRSIDRLVKLSGMRMIPTEVWIDEDDLVRRQVMTMKQTKPQSTTTKVDMRLSDYGKRVTIDPPEDAKDLTELAKKGAAAQLAP